MTSPPPIATVAPPSTEVVDAIAQAVRARLLQRPDIRATYRLQFTRDQFRFPDATAIADYLARLGVSHLYASPTLRARSGSTHGYDVVDPTRLNEELGTEAEYSEFISALKRHGLGQVLDIVPNHMSVATQENQWWMDVLANGPSSPWSHYFDIDWNPVKGELRNRILLPVLGELYGKTLEAGQLVVQLEQGQFFVQLSDLRLPLAPKTWIQILQPGGAALEGQLGSDSPALLEFQSILTGLQYLPDREETSRERIAERRRETLVLQGRLQRLLEESPEIRSFVEANLKTINGEPGRPESFDDLDRLLESQVYRLVMWKAGSDELNYRRFFDVTELAAVCTERLDVFEATHDMAFQLLLRGDVDGFRIDHVDGLFDPTEYLWRLQWTSVRRLVHEELRSTAATEPENERDVEAAVLNRLRADLGGPDPLPLLGLSDRKAIAPDVDLTTGPHPSRQRPLFVVVEKILGADEPLPSGWPVDGTTGYDFLNLQNGLFVEPDGLLRLERAYTRFTERREELKDIIYQSKRVVLSAAMQSEVALLAHRLDRLSNRHRSTRDYTLQALRSAIRELIASFPVYRTYLSGRQISERDRRVVQLAAAQARRRNPAVDPSALQFVRDVLLLEQPPHLDAAGEEEREFFIGRFQQVSSPVMAKGVEDTAFYRYVPLLSLEEVGGEPGHAVVAVSEFHRQNAARRLEWPQAMLATSTHDTKRSEDVRARLNVLSEIPGEWQKAVSRWSRINRRFRRDVDGQPAPSRNDEWMFYQSLVGIWPLSPPDESGFPELLARLQRSMEKAAREAKLSTSWISPNPAYDEAIRTFVAEVLDSRNSRFLLDFQAFLESIIEGGLRNSLAQVTLKLSAPGIPDIYQGQELWDFSLVDPDNRRPVDFARRRELLADLESRLVSPVARLELCRELGANLRDPRAKLLVTHSLLQLRRRLPEFFREGDYEPLEVRGEQAGHVVAFLRRLRSRPDQRLVVIVPRLTQQLRNTAGDGLGGAAFWGETEIQLESREDQVLWNQFTGQSVRAAGGRLALREAFVHFPVAALTAASIPWQ